MPCLAVVLATCEGERFLAEQLASLDRQVRRPDLIIVGDDCSTDGTPQLIEDWASAHAGRIMVLPAPPQRLGITGNFGRLFAAALADGADFVAPCDQDDVWDEQKLAVMEEGLREVRGPGLVVCDLAIVAADLRPISASYWRYQCYAQPSCQDIRRLAVMNAFPGCSMLANRRLIELAIPIPSAAVLHDWWLALIAAGTGGMRSVAKQLVRYRQHGANQYGTRDGRLFSTLAAGVDRHGVAASLRAAADQAGAARKRLAAMATPCAARALEATAACGTAGWMGRRWGLLRAGVGKSGVWRNAWFYAAC